MCNEQLTQGSASEKNESEVKETKVRYNQGLQVNDKHSLHVACPYDALRKMYAGALASQLISRYVRIIAYIMCGMIPVTDLKPITLSQARFTC